RDVAAVRRLVVEGRLVLDDGEVRLDLAADGRSGLHAGGLLGLLRGLAGAEADEVGVGRELALDLGDERLAVHAGGRGGLGRWRRRTGEAPGRGDRRHTPHGTNPDTTH